MLIPQLNMPTTLQIFFVQALLKYKNIEFGEVQEENVKHQALPLFLSLEIYRHHFVEPQFDYCSRS